MYTSQWSGLSRDRRRRRAAEWATRAPSFPADRARPPIRFERWKRPASRCAHRPRKLGKVETARQMVYATAWRFQNGEYPVREITMSKLYAYRIAVEVADDCIQIHGGAGYMQEYGIERSWRDLRLNRIGAGTDEIMLDVIGRSYGL